MSTTMSATLVLGFHLKESQCWKVERARGCKHAEVADANFCAKCGKPTWVEDREPLDDLNSDRFTVVGFNTSDFQYADENGAIAGEEISVDDHTGAAALPPQEEWSAIEQALVAVLAAQGITPTSTFGVYLARYVGC